MLCCTEVAIDEVAVEDAFCTLAGFWQKIIPFLTVFASLLSSSRRATHHITAGYNVKFASIAFEHSLWRLFD